MSNRDHIASAAFGIASAGVGIAVITSAITAIPAAWQSNIHLRAHQQLSRQRRCLGNL